MLMNKVSNYSVIDVDKGGMKPNAPQDCPLITSSRKYSIKKLSDFKTDHSNQNNTLYGENRQLRHRGQLSTDIAPKSRYKSYDYLPARRPPLDQYKNNQYLRREVYNEYSDSGGDNHEDCLDSIHKFRKSYSYGGTKQFSSNEELENSRNFDNDHSSDSSRRYPYRPGRIVDTHSDYHRKSRYNDFEKGKYGKESWNYDNGNSYQDSRRGSRYSPIINKFSKSPGGTKIKQNARGTSYPSYLNNNKSDMSNRKVSSDLHNSRYDDNNDNYSSHHKEVSNRNMLSLKSSYRKNENIPHSGTRLETHRKQLDKYCSGRGREARFNESNNCDDLRRHNSIPSNRSNKTFRSNVPLSPKYSSTKKKYTDSKLGADDRYFIKSKFSTPRRPRVYSHDQGSDNESCYFENCHNSNNECISRYQKDSRGIDKHDCASISDEVSSSSIVISQEKPTESVPLSISSPKFNTGIKPFQSTYSRPSNFGNNFPISSSQKTRNFLTKESPARCNHLQRSSRHHSGNHHN